MLREEFLRLLEEDREFRLIVAGYLGYRDVLERLEEHDRKFNEILERLDRHTKLLEEHSKRLEEHDRKFNEIMERLSVHDRKFYELMMEIQALRKDFQLLSMRVEVTIGSMGRRWGRDLEMMVLEIFREALEKRGIEPGKVEKFRYRDMDGSVTGIKGRIIDIDVFVKDEKLYVIEVKSRAELEHIEALPDKARFVEKIVGKEVERVIVVAVNIDKEAYERARELGVDVIYGNIID